VQEGGGDSAGIAGEMRLRGGKQRFNNRSIFGKSYFVIWTKYFCMYKLAAIFFFVLVIAGTSRLQAQTTTLSLKGTAWKFYVDALHDSLTLHIGVADTNYTTTSAGEVVVRTLSKMQNDTLRFRDIDGEYYCPDGEGVYRVSIEGDYMTYFLISDPCTNRSDALNGIKFRKTTASK
jgi:hypothetical protein